MTRPPAKSMLSTTATATSPFDQAPAAVRPKAITRNTQSHLSHGRAQRWTPSTLLADAPVIGPPTFPVIHSFYDTAEVGSYCNCRSELEGSANAVANQRLHSPGHRWTTGSRPEHGTIPDPRGQASVSHAFARRSSLRPLGYSQPDPVAGSRAPGRDGRVRNPE